ncbi:UDP-N-acetylglucosamine 2-epimerase (non-hydrolyzing) [Paenibacillus sp. LHD-117]|uniref:non-hydrolyzing UDP-N-acetylglucosamine 2-epimerase n=1 Tax=Paenibacillus sp. LHD-117 TaxID=3071412 RepID=UPI0027E0F676|nr:UDP-N-acetylglucosamine 2-epimerase (non-hydrolyzing) [Paenibacillus sp. LHD-117]MDQ6423507.1 UDP-N-acetylglucosamine 2-epimerase (non-hydrolyzing) [Paenibacillus sp. LHD-117]
MTILGTRPEIIRLSRIIPKLDALAERHILLHTGQNYHPSLSEVFFKQLKLREPDYTISLGSHSFGSQIGALFPEVEKIVLKDKPDRVLILGDTNSALCAILCERLGIPVYHMEAGNRCYDPIVPEELNRKVVDAISSVNLPYTANSRDNLLREGIPPSRVWVSGNPIYEVLLHYRMGIDRSAIMKKLKLKPKRFVLVTAHRAENVDNESKLRMIIDGLRYVAQDLQVPVICSVHPRTRAKLELFGITVEEPLLQLHDPFGFFEFVKLQKEAMCVITDSGTVQEESCLLGVPGVIIRRSTERPETVLCGSSVVSGIDARHIADCVKLVTSTPNDWICPEGYMDRHVSAKVVHMLLGGIHHV